MRNYVKTNIFSIFVVFPYLRKVWGVPTSRNSVVVFSVTLVVFSVGSYSSYALPTTTSFFYS